MVKFASNIVNTIFEIIRFNLLFKLFKLVSFKLKQFYEVITIFQSHTTFYCFSKINLINIAKQNQINFTHLNQF